MDIVGNSITEETDVAMDLCTKVQAEEYVIHVVGSTSFYTHLRLSLLASTWFPRPLGVCLWSALHVLLVLYEALMLLMLLVLFPTIFVCAVLMDANTLLAFTIVFTIFSLTGNIAVALLWLYLGIISALVWLSLVITCQCCTMPGRAPGQGLGQYLFTAAGTLPPWTQIPQPAPLVEGGTAATDGPCAFLKEVCRESVLLTRRFVNHVILVSFPYRRAQLGDLCREIVPWYDTLVI